MILYLVKCGVPWEQVEAMSPVRRFATYVALGEIEGNTFNWDESRWMEK